MLSISGAHRTLDSHTLFTDLDLTVRPGECGAIMGPNGSGKSTLLRCVIDDDRLDDGTIDVFGMAPDDRSPEFRALVSAETGEQASFFDLTITEHLQLLWRSHRMDIAGGAVIAALDDAGLADLGDRFPHALSTGQRQRFALCAAFSRPCSLLVLDEPERGLDTDGQNWVIDRVLTAKRSDTAVLLATHSPLIADAVADRTVELGR